MKNIITAPVTTASSLHLATRWALGGLLLAVAILTLLVVAA